jgi:hypothetical protein
MCRIPEDDLARMARGYRRYYGENRDKIRERLRRRLAGERWYRRLLAEAGHVVFASRMRRRGAASIVEESSTAGTKSTTRPRRVEAGMIHPRISVAPVSGAVVSSTMRQ